MEKRKDGFLIDRDEHQKDYLFGIRPIMEALNADQQIDKILVNKELKGELLRELLGMAREKKIPVTKVPESKLNRITRKNHQGVVAYISAIAYASLDNVVDACYSRGVAPLILMLDRVTDVRNFGAIARTAEVAGVHAIVIPEKSSAQINSDAVKTSAGALNFLPVSREKNLYYALKDLKKSGLNVVGVTEKTHRDMYTADFSLPTVLLVGSEEDGISEELMELCDEFVKIPVLGQIESLNVSVATGIVIYEAIRQRNKPA
ncbi:23S rRNA (guanosine2251-2'-O)-methyltransferase [Cyclobacterium lianum]|uniref:23S rRNA (Guanosine2251-2'-O)-methyltransferase n=1 Tax=Cyclobacterium lianum TaxID=388280 RepID=A0A1M7PD98_9BACT|nr:23S rRNA (guanosine(2251)-2'-O)-methyltransferase RlmB [Cyclobacterium lianum]SHN14915.1 23S rRNA (guanosine2251-2'-O)-methyltransferase [Cyclobacterium lianum]